MTSTLVLAIPAKGRLMEAAFAYLEGADVKVERKGGARTYEGSIEGVDGIEVRFLSASEIAAGLISGDLHLGITGLDLLQDSNPESDKFILTLSPLGFGHANVVVAVPEAWIDVVTMVDLAEVAGEFRAKKHRPLRVATKYLQLTRSFFSAKGIADYRIVESMGATEGAPAAGTSEIIVDITSSGETLTANHLKTLNDGLVLESQAFLTASTRATWRETQKEKAKTLLDRITSVECASSLYEELERAISAPVD